MSTMRFRQGRIPGATRRCCSIFLLLLLPVCAAASAVPATDPRGRQTTPESAEVPQLPPRLAPLGLEKLMDLEVSSVTRSQSTLGASAAAVSVITPEDIRRSGATTIAELFRRVPGMNVARIDNNKWAISARGFNDRFSNKLLVQRDGRTLYDPLFAGVYWNTVDYPLEDIERIEVIRGPGASLWGANAVNGIINIISKAAKDTRGGLLSGGGGRPEGGFGELRYGGKTGADVDYRLYAKGFHREEQYSRGVDTHDRWSGASTGARLDWLPNHRDTLTVQGDYLHSESERQDADLVRTPPFISVMADQTIADSTNVLGRWAHRTAKQASWSVQAYWARFKTRQPAARISNISDTYDLDFDHRLPLGERHTFLYGLGYRRVSQSTGNSLSDDGLSLSWSKNYFPLSVYSAFLQDEYQLVPDTVRLLLGVKLEHNDFTGIELQPTGRILWTPSARQSLWAAVSRAVGTPSVSEEAIRLSALFPTTLPSGTQLFPRVTGNPELAPVILVAYEVGHRAQLCASFSLDSALFYHRYDGLVVAVPQAVQGGFAPGTALLPLRLENRMAADTYGAEFATDWRPSSWWRLYGTYTFLRMDLHPDRSLPAGTRTDAQGAEGRSPRHQVFLQSSFDLPHNVEFDLMGRFVDALSGFMQGIPSYLSLDARAAWRPRRNLEISLVGQNLLDDRHPEFGVSPVLASPVVEIRRNVYAKITWGF